MRSFRPFQGQIFRKPTFIFMSHIGQRQLTYKNLSIR
nr:MAG TPA: hypothetical protein [Caudoviricetes sp.]